MLLASRCTWSIHTSRICPLPYSWSVCFLKSHQLDSLKSSMSSAGSCITRSGPLVLSSEIFSVGFLEHIVWMFCVSFLLERWYAWVFLLLVVVLFVLILWLIHQSFFCNHTCWSWVMHPHEALPPVLKGQDSFCPSPCLFVLSYTRFLHSMGDSLWGMMNMPFAGDL